MSATEQIDYQSLTLPYVRAAELNSGRATHHPVVVVGGGPVGFATAIDLAQNGISVLLLDEDDRLSTGS
ncbi:MAG: FAD-dependent oxidoreductase, partial [Xanthobacteraceae bacterium]